MLKVQNYGAPLTDTNTFRYDSTRTDKDYFREWIVDRESVALYYKEDVSWLNWLQRYDREQSLDDPNPHIFGSDRVATTQLGALRGMASKTVHEQKPGACYAHSAATMIRAAESRIYGRKLTPHIKMVQEIVDHYGEDGENTNLVLNELAKSRNLILEQDVTLK